MSGLWSTRQECEASNQIWSESGQLWSNFKPNFAEIGPNVTGFGHVGRFPANDVRFRAKFRQIWRTWGQESVEVGSNLVELWPNLAEFGPLHYEFERTLADVSISGQIWSTPSRTWSIPSRIWSFRPFSAGDCGRSGPAFFAKPDLRSDNLRIRSLKPERERSSVVQQPETKHAEDKRRESLLPAGAPRIWKRKTKKLPGNIKHTLAGNVRNALAGNLRSISL